jgi:superfamily II DNA or RNA helicase
MPGKKNAAARKGGRAKGKKRSAPKLSRLRQPPDLSVEAWQTELRRQYGRDQSFVMRNIGDHPLFSEFAVSNPESETNYRVAIRSNRPGENFCSCPDFATNDLGTCKHVEFVLGRLERKRGAKKALKEGFFAPYSSICLRYGGERRVQFRAGTECPPKLARSAARLFDAAVDWRLPRSAFGQLDAFLTQAQKSGHEVRCYEDALAFIARARDADFRCRVLDEAYPDGARSPALEGLLKTPLYEYQAQGALFAVRAGRALIADDMGLGKTVQAIAATELFAKHFGTERVLIVCPVSLKHQWEREIARFAGRDAQIINGSLAARRAQYRETAFCKITNYETLRRDLDLIQAWQPDVVIVDEAQRIKNWNTIAARALKRIESPYAIVLTGTPLENRVEELVSIVQLVDRHRLGPTWRLLHDHQMRDETGRVIGYRDLNRIGETLAPILLRRRKAEVLDQLPPRIDNTIFVPMTQEQLKAHDENADTVAHIVRRWRKTGYLSDVDQRILTCALQNMRMSCNSTYLLDKTTDHGTKADELATLLGELFEDPGAKAAIFSQWRGTHELIIRRLEANDWGYVLFHGGVPGAKRGAVVDRFRDDPSCRVFLSTDAGGLGLNLQHAASTVINMDLPWNPAVLEQRIGRVHRMGQRRSVQVVNFVAEGTIEEGMLSTLAFKKSLFAGVLDGGEKEIFLEGTRLAKFMESVDAVTGAASRTAQAAAFEARPVSGALPPRSVTGESGADQRPSTALAGDRKAQPLISEAPSPAAPGRQPNAGVAVSTTDPWAGLLDAGLKLIETFATGPSGNGDAQPATSAQWIETDPRTGKSYIKLPIPEPDKVQRVTAALSELIASLRL